MTKLALISSILIGIGSLAWGYSEIGLDAVTRWIIILGVLWLIAAWNGVRWISSVALTLVLLTAAFGLWFQFAPGWMFSGGIFALVAWDLSQFRHRLRFVFAKEDKFGMERRRIARLSILSLIGLSVASVTMLLRGAFTNEWEILLLIVVVLELSQLIVWFRKR